MKSARTHRLAFTLVELLVVIGIIGVLISILLPVLSSVRKQANQTKCATALRELGTCILLYSNDNRGYYPPVMLQPAAGSTYSLNDVVYPVTGTAGEQVPAYWFNFIQKYVTKYKTGAETVDLVTISEVRNRSIIWGCVEWEGIRTTTIGGFNRVMTGYGMNAWPTFSQSNPNPANNTQYPEGVGYKANSGERNLILNFGATTPTGAFQKATVYGRDGAQRALLTDAKSWVAESGLFPSAATPFPPQAYNVSYVNYTQTTNPFTMVDLYRHGKFPKIIPGSPAQALPTGGKVQFNILFCDGHVSQGTDKPTAWKVIRMRFPR